MVYDLSFLCLKESKAKVLITYLEYAKSGKG
uniref:Uncharacterized protein n=1 Tax=Saccharolobus solfataricus (strain 98/2) TaxID=555311 RepID=D0KU36_SACS9